MLMLLDVRKNTAAFTQLIESSQSFFKRLIIANFYSCQAWLNLLSMPENDNTTNNTTLHHTHILQSVKNFVGISQTKPKIVLYLTAHSLIY